MGVSVSTYLAVVFIGLFIVLGAVYTSSANAFERVQDARQAEGELATSVRDTAINVTSTERFNPDNGCGVNITVTNNGTTPLSVNDTDVLVDGRYQTGWRASATVDGDDGTDAWLPREALNASFTGFDSPPDRVRVVTETGVAVTGFPGGALAC
jgi:flagellar protein FlaF